MKLSVAFVALLSLHESRAETRLQIVDRAEADRVFSTASEFNELDCSFSPNRPTIGIDLRFHTGFSVSIPLKNLHGDAREIRVVLRVTPISGPDRPVFLSMLTPVPALDEDPKGDVSLRGEYAIGPGQYAVTSLVSFGDAVCRKQWQLEAKVKAPFDQIPLSISANTAAELPPDPFAETAQTAPRASRSMHVKLLVNFSPAGVDSTIMDSEDVRVIAAILRAVSHEPHFGQFSLVAFSSDQERVLHRQAIASKIDFRALGRAVRRLPTGVVSIRQMQDPRSTTSFLEDLLAKELRAGEQPPDAVVVISPKLSLDERLSDRRFAERGHVGCPVFLLSYNPQPVADPWQGVLAKVVKKAYKGLEYTITSPQDLGKALLHLRSELPSGR